MAESQNDTLAVQLTAIVEALGTARVTRKRIALMTPGVARGKATMNEGHLSQVLNGKKGASDEQVKAILRTLGQLFDDYLADIDRRLRDDTDTTLRGLEQEYGVQRPRWSAVGQPLPRGSLLYVARLVDQRATRAALAGEDVVIDGPPKIGKSSLLNRVADEFEKAYPGDRVRQVDLASLPNDAFKDEASFCEAFLERLGLRSSFTGAAPVQAAVAAIEEWIGGGTARALITIDSLNAAYRDISPNAPKERVVTLMTILGHIGVQRSTTRAGAPITRLALILATARNATVATSPGTMSEVHLGLLPRHGPPRLFETEATKLFEAVLKRHSIVLDPHILDEHVRAAHDEYDGQPMLIHDYADRLAATPDASPAELADEVGPVGDSHLIEVQRMFGKLIEDRDRGSNARTRVLYWLGLTKSDFGDADDDAAWSSPFYRRHRARLP